MSNTNIEQPIKRMNLFQGKKLLADLRDGDYAHAGEAEAIEIVMAKFPKNENRLILDAGCGLGGTAEYLRNNKWGNVIGIDIDRESIEYAQKKYPKCNFQVRNIMELDKSFTETKFDLICLFGVFYSLSNQELALLQLRKVAKNHADLVIFDYIDLSNGTNPMISKTGRTFMPINPPVFEKLLQKTGWSKLSFIDLSNNCLLWYQKLLKKLEEKELAIKEKFGDEWYQRALITYTEIFKAYQNKLLGCGVYTAAF